MFFSIFFQRNVSLPTVVFLRNVSDLLSICWLHQAGLGLGLVFLFWIFFLYISVILQRFHFHFPRFDLNCHLIGPIIIYQ